MTQAIQAIEHVTKEGERWDTLAWRYYGNPFAYGRIVEANPAMDISPLLPSGRVVLVPLLTEAEQQDMTYSANLPPWMRP